LLRREERFGIPHLELIHDVLTQTVRESRDKRRAEAEREKQRKREAELRLKLRRTRRRAFAGGAGVVVLLLGIAFYYYGWISESHTYSRGFSKRWGVAYPVGPLPSSAVSHRSMTYRFTQKGWFGAVQTMEIIDSNYQLTDASIRTYLTDPEAVPNRREAVSRFEFVFDNKGRESRVVSEIARNRFGRMVWGFLYAPIEEQRQKQGEQEQNAKERFAKGMFIGPDGYPQPQSHSRAEFAEIRYDELGFEVEYRFKDREGRPAPGPDDAYGQRLDYEKGRLVRLTSLDEEGKPINDAAGNAGLEAEYDSDGNIIAQRAFDAENESTLVRSGYYEWKAEYDDDWGRQKQQKFFNLRGQPTVEKELTGAHQTTWEYDDRGNAKSIKLYGTQGQPVVAGRPDKERQ